MPKRPKLVGVDPDRSGERTRHSGATEDGATVARRDRKASGEAPHFVVSILDTLCQTTMQTTSLSAAVYFVRMSVCFLVQGLPKNVTQKKLSAYRAATLTMPSSIRRRPEE